MKNLICAVLTMLIISGCSNGGMQTSTIEGVRFNGIVVGSSHALSGVRSALVSSPLSASDNLYIPDKFILDNHKMTFIYNENEIAPYSISGDLQIDIDIDK